MGHISSAKQIVLARDISSIFLNSFFTREVLQPPFSQASGKVTFVHTSILAFLIEGGKENKVLHKSPGLKGINITFKVDPIISHLLA